MGLAKEGSHRNNVKSSEQETRYSGLFPRSVLYLSSAASWEASFVACFFRVWSYGPLKLGLLL